MELSEIINDFISEIEEAANHALDFDKLTFSFSSAPKLFHYCSLESFYNIIESNCFWLSHPKFMNDTSGYRYSIQTTKNFVYEYNQNITKNDASKDFFKLVESSVNEYEFGFKGFDENKYEKINFFTCFTSDGDNLPMWSMYKGKNIGLSIGLDFKNKDYFVKPQEHTGNNAQEVSPFLNFPNAFFTDIEYD